MLLFFDNLVIENIENLVIGNIDNLVIYIENIDNPVKLKTLIIL